MSFQQFSQTNQADFTCTFQPSPNELFKIISQIYFSLSVSIITVDVIYQ